MTQAERRILTTPAVVAIIIIVALFTRAQLFGNPVIYSDEQFYLLVGDRMLHGAIPYVDLWDRKPIGLFLLYAAMRSLGNDGVFAYQLGGTMFAAATALLVVRIAREFAGAGAALAAGIAYLLWLNLGAAGGGQSPLFYNLPVCAAALIVLRATQGRHAPFGGLVGAGSAAMLLVGLAMQIKYSAVFEGLYFGLLLLWLAWRQGGIARAAAAAPLWIAVALAPTAAATAVYYASGDGAAFVFANFLSIFERTDAPAAVLAERLGVIALILAPLLAGAVAGGALPAGRGAHRFVIGWLAAAIAGLIAFGTYHSHYVLPVLVPASAAFVVLFARRQGRIAGIAVLLTAFVAGQAVLAISARNNGDRAQVERIVRTIDPAGCLFVYSGTAVYYRASGACIPTRFAFPAHLSRLRDAAAIGVDPVAEIARVIATRPETVIVRDPYDDENWAGRRVLMAALERDYTRIVQAPLGRQTMAIYRLRAAIQPATAGPPK